MTKTELLLPKFLTADVAQNALLLASRAIAIYPLTEYDQHIKRNMFHIAVFVPATRDARTEPCVLAEISHGNKSDWPYDFAKIARNKGFQLWTGGNDGGTDIKPHLLFKGDTPFWGGVKRDGIVVTCSGFKPWYDRMVAGITADICIALAYDAWMKSPDKADGELCFLT